MHQYTVIAIGKDRQASTLDDRYVIGREAVNEVIKAFRAEYDSKLKSITVWDETAQKPAKGWNDGYR